MITFTITSVQGQLPLTSMLEIDHVSAGLNGTVINCTEVGLNLMNPDTAEIVLLILGQDLTNGKLYIKKLLIIILFSVHTLSLYKY